MKTALIKKIYTLSHNYEIKCQNNQIKSHNYEIKSQNNVIKSHNYEINAIIMR